MKTGTHSIARLFSANYRSGHEVHVERTTSLLQKMEKGALSRQQIGRVLWRRDREWRLECEAAHFLGPFAEVLANEFPQAKFILTVREPRSWLRSVIGQLIKNPRAKFEETNALSEWLKIRDFYFGTPSETFPREEQVLRKHGLHSLGSYLSYWTRHNRQVLDAVPQDRLLVIPTRRISKCIDRIAAFAGVSPRSLASERSHSYKASRKHGLLNEIDEIYIQHRIDECCAEAIDLINRITPILPA